MYDCLLKERSLLRDVKMILNMKWSRSKNQLKRN
jgi:hypothetical protein